MTQVGRGRPRKHADDFAYTNRMSWYLSRGWRKVSLAAREACPNCEFCGVLFDESNPSEVHHVEDPFPTRSLDLLLRRENLRVVCANCHNNTHNAKPPALVICEVCGKSSEINPARAAGRRFCSKTCRWKHPDFTRKEATCPICAKTFVQANPHQVHCGRACANQHTATLKHGKRPSVICCACATSFTVFPSYFARGNKTHMCPSCRADRKSHPHSPK